MFSFLIATVHPLALGNVLLGLASLPTAHPFSFVLATANDAFGVGDFLMGFVNLLSGPVALTFSCLLIISCAIAWYRGHEGHEGWQKLAATGVAIGLLANMVGIWGHFHGSSGLGI